MEEVRYQPIQEVWRGLRAGLRDSGLDGSLLALNAALATAWRSRASPSGTWRVSRFSTKPAWTSGRPSLLREGEARSCGRARLLPSHLDITGPDSRLAGQVAEHHQSHQPHAGKQHPGYQATLAHRLPLFSLSFVFHGAQDLR